MMNISEITKQLSKIVENYFKSQGYEPSDLNHMYEIKSEFDESSNFVDITIYAELSIEEFFELQDSLNSIISKYDKTSYFDILDEGVFLAQIDLSEFNPKQSIEIPKLWLTNFGESICEKLENAFDDTFYVSDITIDNNQLKLAVETSDFEISTTIPIDINLISEYSDLIHLYEYDMYKKLLIDINDFYATQV